MGSSSSSRSGFSRSSLHSATRRRLTTRTGGLTAASPRRAAQSIHRLLELGVEVPRSAASMSSWSVPISAISASKSASGSAISSPMALKRSTLP